MRDLKEILKKSDSKVKAAYIRGFSAAEGCVSRRKIWLVNKDKEELEFIKKLLLDLKITSIGPKFKKGGVFHLYISGKDNLLKFSKFVTFGKHQIRNERLYKTLSSFSLLNRNERIEKILKVLDSPKTTKDISKLIGIKYSWTSLTLKDMVMKGILDTNNARRDRVYFVSSDEKC
jgi:intein-encoded DNA endonuclease-like protein